jgi:hypothetical protein
MVNPVHSVRQEVRTTSELGDRARDTATRAPSRSSRAQEASSHTKQHFMDNFRTPEEIVVISTEPTVKFVSRARVITFAMYRKEASIRALWKSNGRSRLAHFSGVCQTREHANSCHRLQLACHYNR